MFEGKGGSIPYDCQKWIQKDATGSLPIDGLERSEMVLAVNGIRLGARFEHFKYAGMTRWSDRLAVVRIDSNLKEPGTDGLTANLNGLSVVAISLPLERREYAFA